MNFKFFGSLTNEEANKYLDDFLYFGSGRGIEILSQTTHFTVEIDFNVDSLSPIFRSLLTVLKTIPREPDLTIPEFIRNTESYKKNLFDFDEPSKTLLMSAAYYLGETFVGCYSQLSWGIGNAEYIQGNMPVVTGFKHNEMPVILITENMFGGIISGMNDDSSIGSTINAWRSNAEQ